MKRTNSGELLENPTKLQKANDDEEEEFVVETKEDAENGPKIWATVKNASNYEISNYGDLRNKTTMKISTIRPRQDGYVSTNILYDDGVRRSILIHRLVMEVLGPENPKNMPTVNHKNYDMADNRLSNLEWATHLEQNLHRKKCVSNTQRMRPIWKIDADTNEKIHLYGSLKAAIKWLKENNMAITKSNSCIFDVLRGKRQIAYGFKWQYDTSEHNKYDDEEWRDLPEYFLNGVSGYQVSNYGRIKTPKSTKILRGSEKIPGGYLRIHIGKNLYSVHILAALMFIENPENKPNVNHINGLKNDPRVVNLEWVTPSENGKHAYDTGLHARIKSVIAFHIETKTEQRFNSYRDAAKSVGLHPTTVSRCCKGVQAQTKGYIFKHAEVEEDAQE
jgi:hypothetical protein